MKDAIFFHIPKVAGTSIFEVLKKNGGVQFSADKFEKDNYKSFNNKGIVSFGHYDVPSLLKEKIISKRFFDWSFKFAFVRNPWDRMISLYHYSGISRLKKYSTFGDFCHNVEQGIKGESDFSPKPGLFNSKMMSQARPQTDWLLDKDGKSIVDFIGRYEDLHKDFARISQILNLKGELGHLNKMSQRQHPDYYYHSDAIIEMVRRIYKKDIKFFKYKYSQS